MGYATRQVCVKDSSVWVIAWSGECAIAETVTSEGANESTICKIDSGGKQAVMLRLSVGTVLVLATCLNKKFNG